jgi:H/ACA ribonucleoprotein complex subunit 4
MQKIVAPWIIKRELVIKTDEVSDPKFGNNPEKRSPQELIKYGIINLDKTSGPSSHEVTAWIKRMINVKHAGHGGTLEA